MIHVSFCFISVLSIPPVRVILTSWGSCPRCLMRIFISLQVGLIDLNRFILCLYYTRGSDGDLYWPLVDFSNFDVTSFLISRIFYCKRVSIQGQRMVQSEIIGSWGGRGWYKRRRDIGYLAWICRRKPRSYMKPSEKVIFSVNQIPVFQGSEGIIS